MVPIRIQAVHSGHAIGGLANDARSGPTAGTTARTFRVSVIAVRRAGADLSDALHTLTSTRQSSLLSSFLDALTRGGPNGLPRPIELHAHDPTRYVGDMLAWVHQTTASEHEFLESLFGVKERNRMVGSQREPAGDLDEAGELVRDTLDKDLEGLGRPLKVS